MKYRAREREDVLAFVRRYTVRLVEFNSIQIRFEWQQQAKNNNNYNTRQHRGKPTINNNNKKFINKYWNAFESKCTLRIRVHCTRYISFVIFLFLIYEPKKLNQRKRTFIDIRVRFNISIYSLHLPLKIGVCICILRGSTCSCLLALVLSVHLLFLFLSILPGEERRQQSQ